jgi:flavin reductase (DIM6/NTAB) family NADH-FMN oxidoreductase RutF
MNIVTYAMPVNVAPPKLYAISLYKSTLTRAAFLESKVGILQLLSPLQSKLVPILGKRSGLEGFSKKLACADLDIRWRSLRTCCDNLESISRSSRTIDTIITVNAEVLPHCQAYIFLELLNTVDAGDHDVAICQVVATGQWKSDRLVLLGNDDTPATPKDATSVLYSGQLRLEGII